MSFTKTSEILIKNLKSEIGKINVKISEKSKKSGNPTIAAWGKHHLIPEDQGLNCNLIRPDLPGLCKV